MPDIDLIINDVSTHAPRAGSDIRVPCVSTQQTGFNSRSPSGERHALQPSWSASPKFQLTLPERGATGTPSTYAVRSAFQLTLPERGATCR